MRHIEAQQIENLFAGNIRQLLMDAELNYDKLYEIRLRVGRPLFLTYDGGECFLRKPGQEQYLVTREDLKETLEYVTGYSLYAYEDEIRQGYISVQGGHRVGVTGKVVLDRGRIMGMKYISCINVRLAHEIQGCADKVMSYMPQSSSSSVEIRYLDSLLMSVRLMARRFGRRSVRQTAMRMQK